MNEDAEMARKAANAPLTAKKQAAPAPKSSCFSFEAPPSTSASGKQERTQEDSDAAADRASTGLFTLVWYFAVCSCRPTQTLSRARAALERACLYHLLLINMQAHPEGCMCCVQNWLNRVAAERDLKKTHLATCLAVIKMFDTRDLIDFKTKWVPDRQHGGVSQEEMSIFIEQLIPGKPTGAKADACVTFCSLSKGRCTENVPFLVKFVVEGSLRDRCVKIGPSGPLRIHCSLTEHCAHSPADVLAKQGLLCLQAPMT